MRSAVLMLADLKLNFKSAIDFCVSDVAEIDELFGRGHVLDISITYDGGTVNLIAQQTLQV